MSKLQDGLSKSVKDTVSDIGKKTSDVVSATKEKIDEAGGGITGIIEFLKNLFSLNTGARVVAVVIGLLLIAAAVWALAGSAKTEVFKEAIKG